MIQQLKIQPITCCHVITFNLPNPSLHLYAVSHVTDHHREPPRRKARTMTAPQQHSAAVLPPPSLAATASSSDHREHLQRTAAPATTSTVSHRAAATSAQPWPPRHHRQCTCEPEQIHRDSEPSLQRASSHAGKRCGSEATRSNHTVSATHQIFTQHLHLRPRSRCNTNTSIFVQQPCLQLTTATFLHLSRT